MQNWVRQTNRVCTAVRCYCLLNSQPSGEDQEALPIRKCLRVTSCENGRVPSAERNRYALHSCSWNAATGVAWGCVDLFFAKCSMMPRFTSLRNDLRTISSDIPNRRFDLIANPGNVLGLTQLVSHRWSHSAEVETFFQKCNRLPFGPFLSFFLFYERFDLLS